MCAPRNVVVSSARTYCASRVWIHVHSRGLLPYVLLNSVGEFVFGGRQIVCILFGVFLMMKTSLLLHLLVFPTPRPSFPPNSSLYVPKTVSIQFKHSSPTQLKRGKGQRGRGGGFYTSSSSSSSRCGRFPLPGVFCVTGLA